MKGSIIKKILLTLAGVFILIQFYRPEKNTGMAHTGQDITATLEVPAAVMKILETSCYDCHSNHTVYPWYTNIQPIGWWMQDHVNEGKEELNFSVFNSYKPKRQQRKLDEIAELVNKRAMPLPSYLYMHRDAKLSDEQIEVLGNWAASQKIIVPGTDSR